MISHKSLRTRRLTRQTRQLFNFCGLVVRNRGTSHECFTLRKKKECISPCRVERPCTSALRVSTRPAGLTDAFIISVDKAYTHLNVGTMHTIRRSKKEVERAAELVVSGEVATGGGYSGSRGQTAGSRVDVEETEPVPDSGTVSIARGISFGKKRERNLFGISSSEWERFRAHEARSSFLT